jgi:phosphonopyruvate decarboxylase
VATTGKTGRELYEVGDKKNQFYMVGSMGCALAFGFGIAVCKPKLKDKRRLVVLDYGGGTDLDGIKEAVDAFKEGNIQ